MKDLTIKGKARRNMIKVGESCGFWKGMVERDIVRKERKNSLIDERQQK